MEMNSNPGQRYLPYPGGNEKSSVPMPTQSYPLRLPMETIIKSKGPDDIRMTSNPSMPSQSHENRSMVLPAADSQQKFPRTPSGPGATLSSTQGLAKLMHPPSLVPGFQPNKQTQQRGLKPEIVRKPVAEGPLQSRSGEHYPPGGSHQTPLMPAKQPRVVPNHIAPTVPQPILDRQPARPSTRPKRVHNPIPVAPLFF
ncbi:hypothetical protein V8E51_014367 [Hyaloscypha variabilis]